MKTTAAFTEDFSRSARIALLVALTTIVLALTVPISHVSILNTIAEWLGSWGNDLFLISTNLLIIAWAWRRRLRSLMALTLWMDFVVWLSVQGTKLLMLGNQWALRPNGHEGGFPSGHATHGFAMAFLLTTLFPRFAWLWYLSAISISWSRIETSFHSGVQVAAGVLLGVTIGWALVNNWLKRQETSARTSDTTLEPAAVKQVS